MYLKYLYDIICLVALISLDNKKEKTVKCLLKTSCL